MSGNERQLEAIAFNQPRITNYSIFITGIGWNVGIGKCQQLSTTLVIACSREATCLRSSQKTDPILSSML